MPLVPIVSADRRKRREHLLPLNFSVTKYLPIPPLVTVVEQTFSVITVGEVPRMTSF